MSGFLVLKIFTVSWKFAKRIDHTSVVSLLGGGAAFSFVLSPSAHWLKLQASYKGQLALQTRLTRPEVDSILRGMQQWRTMYPFCCFQQLQIYFRVTVVSLYRLPRGFYKLDTLPWRTGSA